MKRREFAGEALDHQCAPPRGRTRADSSLQNSRRMCVTGLLPYIVGGLLLVELSQHYGPKTVFLFSHSID